MYCNMQNAILSAPVFFLNSLLKQIPRETRPLKGHWVYTRILVQAWRAEQRTQPFVDV